jgi:outer membrane cobalamin receptor
VFYDNGKGKTYAGTAGVTFEKREGGRAGAHQTLETKGADGTLSGQRPLGRYILSGIGSLFVKSRTRVLSDAREEERWEAATIELSLRGNATRHTWVAGIGSDWYALRSNDETPAKYSSTRPTMFFHDEMTVTPWLLASGSLRFDHDITYGFYVSPRGSVLVREGPWAARITGGRSYFAPRPLTEETEAAGLARLTIAGPSDVEVSTANNVSGDFSHTTRSTSLMLMVFRSRVDHPAQIDRSTYTLRTGAEPMVVRGVEILGTVRRAPVSLTGSYTFLKTRQRGDEEIARNPRHSGGFVAALESSRGRIGVEFLFTGEQRLDNNPYRTVSESYSLVGLLGEYRFGRWRVFVNADNLTDVRQTDWDPIVRPARDVDGRWTVDAWAPLYGRVINAGFRVSF